MPLTLVSLVDVGSGGFSAVCIPEMPAGLITVFGRVGDRTDWLLGRSKVGENPPAQQNKRRLITEGSAGVNCSVDAQVDVELRQCVLMQELTLPSDTAEKGDVSLHDRVMCQSFEHYKESQALILQ